MTMLVTYQEEQYLSNIKTFQKLSPPFRNAGSRLEALYLNNTFHEIHETCPSVTFYFLMNSLSDISRKCISPNLIRAVLCYEKNSFLDISRKCISPNMIRAVPALMILGKMHFQRI